MLSVVMPAYNEESNLPHLLEDILKLEKAVKKECKESTEVIVVDDNSSDNTGKIADSYAKKYKNIHVIHRKKGNNGMGFALCEGTRQAGGDIVLWVMGDRSDDLYTAINMVNKIKEGYDMVMGSRYMEGGTSGDLSLFKALMSRGYTFVAKAIFGLGVHDITNAFRCFKKEVFSNINLDSGNFAISPEFAIKAHLKGYRLSEVPTTYKNRKAGKTKFKLFKMGVAYIKLFKYRVFS